MEELDATTWQARAAAHAARLAPYVEPHLARRRRGESHPVHDFLFSYYSQRPAQLLRWHPGFGRRLLDAPAYDQQTGYAGGAVTRDQLDARGSLLTATHRLLTATASRPAHTGCFGLHEWAMVYRAAATGTGADAGTRHPQPLRLGGAGTDSVVESHRIACSHFDAFRFFPAAARPLNTLQPRSEDRPEFEQPGCLHAGMDLYKHALRLTPLVSSDLVADCFELAWDIRILDMRAAPYDLSGVVMDPTGERWTPVMIETAEGKQEYAAAQRAFADRGAPLRQRLVEESERLLSALHP